MSANQILKCINRIDCNKSSGEDIPEKMAKGKLTILKPNWISVFHQALFWMKLKLLALSQSTKNKMWMIKLTIDQLVYYQFIQK